MSQEEIAPLDAVESRLSRLEAANRRLRVALGLAVLGAAGLVFAGFVQDARREITTQRLIINGPDNQPRLMLTGSGDGSSLFLYGPEKHSDSNTGGDGGGGGARSTQGVGGFVTLKPRMRFLVGQDDAKFIMLDSRSRDRLVLTVDESGPSVTMLDEDGNEID